METCFPSYLPIHDIESDSSDDSIEVPEHSELTAWHTFADDERLDILSKEAKSDERLAKSDARAGTALEEESVTERFVAKFCPPQFQTMTKTLLAKVYKEVLEESNQEIVEKYRELRSGLRNIQQECNRIRDEFQTMDREVAHLTVKSLEVMKICIERQRQRAIDEYLTEVLGALEIMNVGFSMVIPLSCAENPNENSQEASSETTVSSDSTTTIHSVSERKNRRLSLRGMKAIRQRFRRSIGKGTEDVKKIKSDETGLRTQAEEMLDEEDAEYGVRASASQ